VHELASLQRAMASSWLQRCIPHRPAARLLDSATSPRPGPRLGWRLDMCAGRVDGRVAACGGRRGLAKWSRVLGCWALGRWGAGVLVAGRGSPCRLQRRQRCGSQSLTSLSSHQSSNLTRNGSIHPSHLLFLPVAPAHDDMDMSGWCGYGGSGGRGDGGGGGGAGLRSTLDAGSMRGRVAAYLLPAACRLPINNHHHLTHHHPHSRPTPHPHSPPLPQALPP
jgi:hypothetical protein